MGMNTQDLAWAVASAKKMLDASGWVGSERRLQVAKALLAAVAEIDALRSRHAAMVGELESLFELMEHDTYGLGHHSDGCKKCLLRTILSQHAAEGKEEGRG